MIAELEGDCLAVVTDHPKVAVRRGTVADHVSVPPKSEPASFVIPLYLQPFDDELGVSGVSPDHVRI
jgi:hypothetical protein